MNALLNYNKHIYTLNYTPYDIFPPLDKCRPDISNGYIGNANEIHHKLLKNTIVTYADTINNKLNINFYFECHTYTSEKKTLSFCNNDITKYYPILYVLLYYFK